MLVLYIVLVLCTIAVVGTGIALYVRVRRHMREEQARKRENQTVAPRSS